MRRRVNPHRRCIRIFGCDVVIHLEQVPVSLFDRWASETADRVREIEIDAAPARTDASSFVTDFFCGARGDIGDFTWRALVAFLFRHPDASVIAQRLRHQRQLRLVFACLRNACRMNLRVAGIREIRSAPMRAPDGSAIRGLGVCRQIENIRIAAGAEDDCIAGVSFNGASHEIARNDALRLSVDYDQIEHFVAIEHLHASKSDLTFQRLKCAEEKLLPRLAARVKRSRDLNSAK